MLDVIVFPLCHIKTNPLKKKKKGISGNFALILMGPFTEYRGTDIETDVYWTYYIADIHHACASIFLLYG